MSAFVRLNIEKHKPKSVFCCVVEIVFKFLAFGKSDFINNFFFHIACYIEIEIATMINLFYICKCVTDLMYVVYSPQLHLSAL